LEINRIISIPKLAKLITSIYHSPTSQLDTPPIVLKGALPPCIPLCVLII